LRVGNPATYVLTEADNRTKRGSRAIFLTRQRWQKITSLFILVDEFLLSRHAVPMLNDVYNAKILSLAGNIPRQGRLSAPDASASVHSRLCGSAVTVDLKVDGDIVSDFAHDVKACALGQASSSLMASHIVGAKAADLRALRESIRKMLKEGGPVPDGPWADFAVLEPVKDFKARHASTLLTFDAVVDCLDQIERRKQAAE
jgi:NifU-like protein involved in Fe-S cluster formation